MRIELRENLNQYESYQRYLRYSNDTEIVERFKGNESFSEAEKILSKNFESFSKSLQRFLTKLNRPFNSHEERENYKTKRFRELCAYEYIMLDCLDGGMKSLPLSEPEISRLTFQLNLFFIMNRTFMQSAVELEKYSRPQKPDKLNLINRANAETQQYIATNLLMNPAVNNLHFSKYGKVAEETYLRPYKDNSGARLRDVYKDELFESQKKAVYGLVAAFDHYSRQGHRVLFTSPEIDANHMTDLIIIKDKMIFEQKNNKPELLEEYQTTDWENIDCLNSLSEELREYVFKVQVKCRSNQSEKTKEENYFYHLDKNQKIDYSSETGVFFATQGQESRHNCKYISVSETYASEVIDDIQK